MAVANDRYPGCHDAIAGRQSSQDFDAGLCQFTERYGQQIEQNIRQARYLTSLVENEPDLELLAPTAMNIVNFRFIANGFDDEQLNDLNAEILMLLQERGIAAPSSTELGGRFSIRVAICNHRSRRSDFEALVNAVKEIGQELLAMRLNTS